MAEVLVMPGIERRDMLVPLESADVLNGALEAGVIDATVIGRSRDGQFYVASAIDDADRVVGFLHRAINHIAGSTIYNDQTRNTDDAS